VAPSPQGSGSWTPCRAVVAVLADEVLARPELLRAAAEALAFRSDGEIVVDAPGADPAAIAPGIEALLADAGLDGDDTEVSLLCVPAEVGDAAMRDAGATVLGSRPASPELAALPRLDLDAAWVLRPVAQLDRPWVGDSHSTYFAQKPLHHATPADRGEAAAWLGPRLMFSLAGDGFPDPLTPHLDGAALDVGSLALAAGEMTAASTSPSASPRATGSTSSGATSSAPSSCATGSAPRTSSSSGRCRRRMSGSSTPTSRARARSPSASRRRGCSSCACARRCSGSATPP
jgi:hypothetical protein